MKISANPIHIVCVLDASGSMASSADKVIKSFNEIISRYKETFAEEARVSLYTFGNTVTCAYKNTHLSEAVELTSDVYSPGGMTALNDAVGKAIEDHTTCERVFFVVDTDGFENCSVEYKPDMIRDLIQLKTAAGWDFTFVGADLTQEQVTQMATSLGMVGASASMTFDKSEMGYATRSAALYNKLADYNLKAQ